MSSVQTDGSGFQLDKMPRIESFIFRITDKVWDMASFVGVYILALTFGITWLKDIMLVVGFISHPSVFFTLLRLLHYTLKALYTIIIELLLFRLGNFACRLLYMLIPNSIYDLKIRMPTLGEESSWIDEPLTEVNPSCYSELQNASDHLVYDSWNETNWSEVEYYQLGEGDHQYSRDQSHEASGATEEEDCPDSEKVFQPKHEIERDMLYNGHARHRSGQHDTTKTSQHTAPEACSVNHSTDEYPRRQQRYGKQVSCYESSRPTHSKQKRHSLPHSANPLPSKPNITRHSTHVGPQSTHGKVPSYRQPTICTSSHVKHSQVKPSNKRDDSPRRVPRMPTESRETQMDKRRQSVNYVPLTRDASSSPKTRRALSRSSESLFKAMPSTKGTSPRPESPRPGSPRTVSPRPVSPRTVSPRPESPRLESPRLESPRPRRRYYTCSEPSVSSTEHSIKAEATLSQKVHRKSTGTLIETNTLHQLTEFTPLDDSIIENTETNMGDTYQPEMSEEEAMSLISDGHDSFMRTIATRRPVMDLMQQQYTHGNIQGALDTAMKSCDEAATVNLLSAVIKRPDALSLNLAISILPVVKDLLDTEHEHFVVTACEMLRLILVQFREVIQGNMQRKPSIGVDLAQAERTEKSVRFYRIVEDICELLGDSHCLYESMSNTFKELKLLISMLD